MVRIALVTDAWAPQVNGVATTLGACVRELSAVGHEVAVLHPGLFRPGLEPACRLARPILLCVGRVAVEENIGACSALDRHASKVVVGDGPARAAPGG